MNEIQKAALLSKLTDVSKVAPKLPTQVTGTAQGDRSFDSILDQTSAVQFSKHAEKRLQSRNIDLSAEDKSKLTDAVHSLQKKGAKDSLVLMGNLAFIVNIPSKTVVTALAKDQMNEQVFTNIDSTMFVGR